MNRGTNSESDGLAVVEISNESTRVAFMALCRTMGIPLYRRTRGRQAVAVRCSEELCETLIERAARIAICMDCFKLEALRALIEATERHCEPGLKRVILSLRKLIQSDSEALELQEAAAQMLRSRDARGRGVRSHASASLN